MLARLSLEGLKEELKSLELRDTWLKLDLAGRDPDDGMTAIAYDKGYFFLRMMEERVGRKNWDAFLKGYFDKHAFGSMTTEAFINYLNTNLEHDADLKKWVYGPGLPADCPEVKTAELAQVAKDAKSFLSGTTPGNLTTDKYTTHHWLHFLRSLDQPLSTQQMAALDNAFQLTKSGNAEITHDWMLHVIASKYEPGMDRLEQFLTKQGRRKFLTPLYRQMLACKETKRANSIYAKARPMYHAVSRQTMDALLKWQR